MVANKFTFLRIKPMADETSMSPTADTAPAEAPAALKEKKTRAPRKPKTSSAVADTSVSTAAKKTRGPGRKKAVASEAAVRAPIAKTPDTSKTPAVTGKAQPAKRAPRKVEAAPAAIDGFSELLKLEEENQKLREALSEKLRAENAELRKKLGTV
jgi:putative transposase